MIWLCTQKDFPYSLFSDGFAEAFCGLGLPARFVTLGFNSLFAMERYLPARTHSLLAFTNLRIGSNRLLKEIAPGDIVISYEMVGLLSKFGDGWFHRAVKKRGAKLVCIIQDAWPIVKNSELHMRGCDVRAREADLIGAVTPNLVTLLKRFYPDSKIALMEEAFDVNSLAPDFGRNEPIVSWSARPYYLRQVLEMQPVLESVFRKVPFRIRIASGKHPPKIQTDIPIDWIPFGGHVSAQHFSGATIAFSLYKNDEYSLCKGNYKVKTYLAAGCAVVTSPVGYNLEMIQPGVNGLFATTPEEWESAFLRLLCNPAERLAMRKAARETAVRRFSYDVIARQYTRVLRENGILNT